MYHRSALHNEIYINMIKFLAERLLDSRYSVLANHIDWPYGAPPHFFEYQPDIYASNSFEKIIYAVETRDTFNSNHTLDKLKCFDSAKIHGIKTCLVLPVSIGLNTHINNSQLLLKKAKLLDIRVISCDLRRREIKFI